MSVQLLEPCREARVAVVPQHFRLFGHHRPNVGVDQEIEQLGMEIAHLFRFDRTVCVVGGQFGHSLGRRGRGMSPLISRCIACGRVVAIVFKRQIRRGGRCSAKSLFGRQCPSSAKRVSKICSPYSLGALPTSAAASQSETFSLWAKRLLTLPGTYSDMVSAKPRVSSVRKTGAVSDLRRGSGTRICTSGDFRSAKSAAGTKSGRGRSARLSSHKSKRQRSSSKLPASYSPIGATTWE